MPHQLRALVRALDINVPRPSSADAQAAVAAYHQDAFFDAFRQRNMDEWSPILLADTEYRV